MAVRVTVEPVPHYVDAERWLGPGPWTLDGERATATLERLAAAAVAARLRGLGFAGRPVEVRVTPPLKRALVRKARLEESRMRRAGSPAFRRPGTRLDDEARWSLTPEPLAMALAQRHAGASVIDATCGAGGNAIAFARHGCRVLAIDRDRGRLDMARHNAHVYGVASAIAFVHGNACDLVPGRSADLLFVDPPWGVDYSRVGTTPDDLPLLEALKTRWSGPMLAKTPASFDPSTLPDAHAEAWFGAGEGDRQRIKFLLIAFVGTAPA